MLDQMSFDCSFSVSNFEIFQISFMKFSVAKLKFQSRIEILDFLVAVALDLTSFSDLFSSKLSLKLFELKISMISSFVSQNEELQAFWWIEVAGSLWLHS